MKLELYYPSKSPIDQQNLFGANPTEYEPLGQLGHPGNDFECPVGTPVYAPCDGDAFYTTDKYGGAGLWLRVPNNATPEYNIILWHMPVADGKSYAISTIRGDVTPVKAGQLLGVSGNSGFPTESTGPHLHLGVMPCDATGSSSVANNGYLGCIDPQPYFNGLYAEYIKPDMAILTTTANVVAGIAADTTDTPAQKLNWLQAIALAIKKLFNS